MRRGSIATEGTNFDGDFRTSIQGSPESLLQFCLESGESCLLQPILNVNVDVLHQIDVQCLAF
jgi:hypothetical protein